MYQYQLCMSRSMRDEISAAWVIAPAQKLLVFLFITLLRFSEDSWKRNGLWGTLNKSWFCSKLFIGWSQSVLTSMVSMFDDEVLGSGACVKVWLLLQLCVGRSAWGGVEAGDTAELLAASTSRIVEPGLCHRTSCMQGFCLKNKSQRQS